MTYATSPTYLLYLLALCLSTGWIAAAHAQVQRCTDAKGHTTYTDGPCLQGQRSREVVPAMTAEERALQNLRYEQAMERRREEQLINEQREAARQAEQAAEAARRPAPPVVVHVPPQSPAQPPAEVIYPPAYYPPPPPRAHPAPPVRPQPRPDNGNTQCNALRCYDTPAPTPGRMLGRP